MKKLLPLLLIVVLLTGCGILRPPASPTPSDNDMATRVAQVLTQMPTPTTGSKQAEPTAELPTVEQATSYPFEVTTEAPAETAAPAQPTETQAPPAQPTATQSQAQPTTSSGGVPTVAITPIIPNATPTNTTTPPASDPKTKLGSATWVDNMDNGDAWPKGDDKYTSIDFQNGNMLLTAETGTDGWRLTWPTIKDFYLEMVMKPGTCSGSDHYGMFVRVPEPTKADQGYLFGLTCDGRYSLRRWNARVGTKGEMAWLINWKSSNSINSGANQTNRLGLLAQGSRLTLYVNGVKLDEVNDNTFTAEGGFGIFVGSDETDKFTISIDQVSYWKDPNL